MNNQPEIITDDQRLPLASPQARAFIEVLREHPAAPRFSARSGNRLTQAMLEQVQAYAQLCAQPPPPLAPGKHPAWMDELAQHCYRTVPFYRRRTPLPAAWEDIPCLTRNDLSQDPYAFIPDHVPAEGLIKYTTTGTSGHPLLVPSHPIVAGCYIPLLERALRRHGITLQSRQNQVACVLIGYQQNCFTYVSVTPLLDESAFVKINLHPRDWRQPADREKYLDACAPEIITGDPISFSYLLELPLRHKPRALISTSMTLLPALKHKLEDRFECPVVDIYSLNETGPIAASLPDGRLGLLQPWLFVEVLDAAGKNCPPGVRGEITVTGGFNFCLPLLRYRTGDYAALTHEEPIPILSQFEGRPPTQFRTARGTLINNIEVTHALQSLSLSQFTLHQFADGAFRMQVRPPCSPLELIRAALQPLLGAEARLEVVESNTLGEKVLQYTSDIPHDPL